VALFVARARAARPEFAVTRDNAPAVIALCRALDGLPLAIELAASQVGLMSPAELLKRLDRALRHVSRGQAPGPERHRALQVTIGWSYDLLEDDVRQLYAELAVFAGGWTLEAAESVCDPARDVIGGMAALVDHSLVRVSGTDADPRFGMLETIREYAAARLDTSGLRTDVEERHASYCEALANAAEPHLRGNPGAWIARLEGEHDNLRAALDRRTGQGDTAGEARLAGALWRFWYLAGHLDEGRRRLEHAVEVHSEATPARAKVLIGAAVMAVNTMDPGVARERAAEAIELCRALDDARGAAYAQFMLGAAFGALGDPGGARSAEEASLRAFRELGDEHSALLVSRNLAGTLESLGDRQGAEALYRDNLRRARAARNGRLEASTLGALAAIAFDEGRVADAMLMLRECLRLHRELSDRLDTSVDLGRAARLLAMSGQPDAAALLLGALSAIRDQVGARGRTVGTLADATSASLRRQLGEDRLVQLVRDGEGLRLGEAIELALEALR
jgi:tetratricopeptide (TPR) repeat protein